nr:PREDICTED: uncharacterized protein LOC109043714 [Bemisia tabaci]
MGAVSCFLSLLVWSHGVDVLVRGAAIDIDTTVISHGNDIPRLRTLDELISSRKPQSHVSKVAKITYEDEDRPFNVGSGLKDNTPKWTSEDNRNEEIGKAIQFMKFISNVDNFLASKAKELLRGMHNMISDKGNLGAIFSVDSEDSRDHGRMPRLLMESWPGYDEDRHGWAKREIGKPDPDLQAKRIQDLEKAKKFMQIVGQVDAYVSDRAKTLLKSLHNIIDHRQGSSSGFSNRL